MAHIITYTASTRPTLITANFASFTVETQDGCSSAGPFALFVSHNHGFVEDDQILEFLNGAVIYGYPFCEISLFLWPVFVGVKLCLA